MTKYVGSSDCGYLKEENIYQMFMIVDTLQKQITLNVSDPWYLTEDN
jgi:hypothetical protein